MATSRNPWPDIPRHINGLAGEIRVVVRRVASFRAADGDECVGLWNPEKRRIDIAGKVSPATRWHTLAHEWAHSWLDDSGAKSLLHGTDQERERNIEVVCDSLATALVRALRPQS
jgi:Zn-dependent peptidase ImmA (M78 family)